jgi:pantoate--beta-alanine ligase
LTAYGTLKLVIVIKQGEGRKVPLISSIFDFPLPPEKTSMLIFKTVADLQSWLRIKRREHPSIGFVPTMGALHNGHISLVRLAKRAGETVVASIFVNPTQFNDSADLEKYPRTPGRDLEMLLRANCDAVFMPSVEEVYPPGLDLRVQIDLDHLDQVMEGAFRPGHFEGMMTVVKRLLDIVQPDHLYMGQKDFQQLTIVANMIWQLGLDVQLIMVHTIRERDGLAMSSRNTRLSPDERRLAPTIYKTLEWARVQAYQHPLQAVAAAAFDQLAAAGFRPEYFEMVDGHTLLPVADLSEAGLIVACVAAWLGNVRLIDNVVIKSDR